MSTITGSTNSEIKSRQSVIPEPSFWDQTSPELPPCHYGYDYDDDHVDLAGNSMVTYASTDESELEDEDEEPPIEVARKRRENHPAKTVPTTPPTFGSLFPSTRRLMIQHDDSSDGNMNLRIDTFIPKNGRDDFRVILFHLRMHDLYRRKFSLRRYCRNSGREVCHSERIEGAPGKEGPYDHKGNHHLNLAFRGAHAKQQNNELRRYASAPQRLNNKHTDSGDSSPDSVPMGRRRQMTDAIKLEFSNYAHVTITRRGRDSSVHYDFEYWGVKYQWKKMTLRRKTGQDAAYCLYPVRRSTSIARINFSVLTPEEIDEEEKKGGWVLPCSIRINDPMTYAKGGDIADIASTVAKALDKVLHPHRRHYKDPYGGSLRRFASHG
ncbi:hypothetical protein KEM54_000758 [Ascosphaera aggregata]|nr:hypothetical protein KEM54_000758 [Ascosphaera aggregata]